MSRAILSLLMGPKPNKMRLRERSLDAPTRLSRCLLPVASALPEPFSPHGITCGLESGTGT